ncbi:hypothetical protein RCL_jg11284.t1 [Rhizophagus clarus]|uniref:Uncharacterized protein n=1 Tax=Rhizophagus clarus TaxID=94130 RepID=A0A8H3LKG4_9GLOM|nr:hypothetical protein RCL_jg11284.t1 [Rhizophagus clarus]
MVVREGTIVLVVKRHQFFTCKNKKNSTIEKKLSQQSLEAATEAKEKEELVQKNLQLQQQLLQLQEQVEY